MSSSTLIPEAIHSATAYLENAELVGSGEIQLPSFEAITVDVQGAGIAGKVGVPLKGIFDNLTMTINWRMQTDHYMTLMEPKAHKLDLYADHQEYDTSTGETADRSFHIFVRCRRTSGDMGKLTTGESSDSSSEFMIDYIKIEKDGKEVLEHDKYNWIYRVNGVDYLEPVRKALGKG